VSGYVFPANPAGSADYDALGASKHIHGEATVDVNFIPLNVKVRNVRDSFMQLTFPPSNQSRCGHKVFYTHTAERQMMHIA
jgi:hypothetical protein